MSRLFKYLPVLLWIVALAVTLMGIINTGYQFVQSRGSILCLSCMGLEENEDF